mmetsp:Transcript_4002/g.5909  ORF Transcript_4002/g.5909 Transcript_4002/m.5909 type:complete len:352 (-) Transcript_4002:140-1195(-)
MEFLALFASRQPCHALTPTLIAPLLAVASRQPLTKDGRELTKRAKSILGSSFSKSLGKPTQGQTNQEQIAAAAREGVAEVIKMCYSKPQTSKSETSFGHLASIALIYLSRVIIEAEDQTIQSNKKNKLSKLDEKENGTKKKGLDWVADTYSDIFSTYMTRRCRLNYAFFLNMARELPMVAVNLIELVSTFAANLAEDRKARNDFHRKEACNLCTVILKTWPKAYPEDSKLGKNKFVSSVPILLNAAIKITGKEAFKKDDKQRVGILFIGAVASSARRILGDKCREEFGKKGIEVVSKLDSIVAKRPSLKKFVTSARYLWKFVEDEEVDIQIDDEKKQLKKGKKKRKSKGKK